MDHPPPMKIPPAMHPNDPTMQYSLVNNKKINISVHTITLTKYMHHLKEIHDMPLLIKII